MTLFSCLKLLEHACFFRVCKYVFVFYNHGLFHAIYASRVELYYKYYTTVSDCSRYTWIETSFKFTLQVQVLIPHMYCHQHCNAIQIHWSVRAYTEKKYGLCFSN